MLTHLPHHARGQTNLGWLQSAHSFSFGRYQNPAYMGFGPLRVINQDYVAANGGFSPHRHANMEIISLVLSGALAHGDSLGNASHILAGDVQLMSAGAGIEHSEMNPSATEPVHFLQIWIEPSQINTPPRYQQQNFALNQTQTLLVSTDGRDGSLQILQDVALSRIQLAANQTLDLPLNPQRLYWLQIIAGNLTANTQTLVAGDGLAIKAENALQLVASDKADLLFFDMAA